MPSKFVAKSFVRGEIVHLRNEMLEKLAETKTEIVEQANQLIRAACDVDPGHVDGTVDFGDTAKEIVSRMGVMLNIHDEKLGMLTEAGIRRVVEEERGKDWASPRKVTSMLDVINYIGDQSGEAQPWIDRAVSTTIDLFKESDGVIRLAMLIQAVIENSDDESWEALRSVVAVYPVPRGSNIDSEVFRRLLHPAPWYLKKIFRELNAMLSPGQRETYYDYDQFMKTGASLMVAFILIDDDYELGKFELPPHILEFDLGGALIFESNTAMLEGGEVKSSASQFRVAEGQLFRRFILVSNFVCILFPTIEKIKAYGYVFAPRLRKDRAIEDSKVLEYMHRKSSRLEIEMERRLIGFI